MFNKKTLFIPFIVLAFFSIESFPNPCKNTFLTNTQYLQAVKTGNIKEIEKQLKLGANIDARYENGNTAFLEAIETGKLELVSFFMKKQLDLKARNNNGDTALIIATIVGDQDKLKLLVGKDIDINAKDNKGNTALLLATKRNYTEIAQTLIDLGADVTIANNYRETPLSYAGLNNNPDLIVSLLEKGADPKVRDILGNEALPDLSTETSQNSLKIIIPGKSSVPKNKVNVLIWTKYNKLIKDLFELNNLAFDSKIRSGTTVLIKAELEPSQAYFLVDKGADVFATNKEGESAFMWSSYLEQKDTEAKEVIPFLIKKAQSLHIKKIPGDTTFKDLDLEFMNLHSVFKKINNSSLKPDTSPAIVWASPNKKITDFMWENGQDISKIDKNRQTPLMKAINEKHKPLIWFLLERGADIHAQDKNGMTALHWAVRNDLDIEIVETLLKQGAEVNQRDNQGMTPLMWTVRLGSLKLVDLLLKWRADLQNIDLQGDTAITLALEHDQTELAIKFLKRRDNFINQDLANALNMNKADLATKIIKNWKTLRHRELIEIQKLYSYSMKTGNLDIFQLLIEKGFDVNTLDVFGNTPLTFALKYKQKHIAWFLLERGARADIINKSGIGPIIYGLESSDKALIQALVNNGADVNMSIKGLNLLHFFARFGDTISTQLLLDFGANPNSVGEGGLTPLMTLEKNTVEIAKILLDHKANLNSVDEAGWTALDHAVEKRDAQLALFLVEKGIDINPNSKSALYVWWSALQLDNAKIMRQLIKKGVDPNTKYQMATTFEVAFKFGKPAVLKMFLDTNLDKIDPVIILNVLNSSLRHGQTEIAKAILETEGLKIDIDEDSKEMTHMFFYAKKTGDKKLLQLFNEKL